MIQDKLIEKERYNHIAKIILEQSPTQFDKPGSYAIPFVFRQPYLFYEEKQNLLNLLLMYVKLRLVADCLHIV